MKGRPEIAAAARGWIGTPFRWQGAARGVGCDCKGLVAGVARECGRPEADSVEALCGDYGAIVPTARLRVGLARLFDRAADIQAGDVLLLNMGGRAQHLAIAAGGGAMIHCYPHGPKARVLEAALPMAKLDSVWRWREAR